MKLGKKILLTVFAACLSVGIAIFAASCRNNAPKTYAVTYNFGSCGDTAYEGTSTLPTETEKEEGATFSLAQAPVWAGYTFLGWNDGEQAYSAGVQYTMPARAVTLTATWEKDGTYIPTYAVTYSLGSFGNTAYAGASTLPTETEKAEGATFSLAEAPVWAGYSFDGWSDGTNVYDAGEEYTMPSRAVTFTAQWEDYPEGHVRDTNVALSTWNEGVTTGGYKIEKGQMVQLTAHISEKGTSDSASGVAGKLIANCDLDRGANGNFYQCRPDFIVKRDNWSWNENNDGLNVNDEGWNRETWRTTTEGDIVITVALNENGVLSYTVEFTSENYSHKRVFTTKDTMNSALVFFGADNCTVTNASMIYPSSNGVKLSFDLNYDDQVNVTNVEVGSTYTFTSDPTRTGYYFLGWQVNGAGAYYKRGDSYSVGKKQVKFIAAWVEDVTMTIDKNGGSGSSLYKPQKTYNTETGKFEILGFPSFTENSFKNGSLVFKCWEVTVNDVVVTVEGDTFFVEPNSAITFKAIWGDKLVLSYALGECEGTPYGGTSKTPTAVNRAEGGTVTLTVEPKEWAGYRFLGWSDGETTYAAGAKYTMPDHNVTMTAQWEMLPRYTVTFVAGSFGNTAYNGQNVIDEQEPMYEGGMFGLARELKWAGYTFLGWSDGEETYKALYRYTMPAHNVTFTAQWEKIPTHTVTYLTGSDDDDVINMPTDTEYYEEQMFMTLPIRYGYTFLGWSDGQNVYKMGEKITRTDDNVTLTAQWEAVEDPQIVILSGLWKYEDDDGTVYFPISGTEMAYDRFKSLGAYQAGPCDTFKFTETAITFYMNYGKRGNATPSTAKFTCTYHYDSDTITISMWGYTLTRVTDKPDIDTDATVNDVALDSANTTYELIAVPVRKNGFDE